MRTFHLCSYSVPMVDGVYLSSQRLKQREGYLLFLTEDNKLGRGEISPLLGHNQETLTLAHQAALTWLNSWQQGQAPVETGLPSVDFGISCALAELEGQLPTCAILPDVPNCIGDPDELILQFARTPLAQVNVGLYESIRDGLVTTLLLESLPQLHLRLTGCQSWTSTKSEGFLKYLAPAVRHRIDYISEPCQTLSASLHLSKTSGLPLAIDLAQHPSNEWHHASEVTTLILKPTLIGSLTRCQQWIQFAQQTGRQVVIEHCYETSLGLSQLAAFANQYVPDTPALLNTLSLMTTQVVQPIEGCTLPLLTQAQWIERDA